MGEEESVNEVSKIDSNGKSLSEKALNETTEKKDLVADAGIHLENNGVKVLKEDDVKEMEEDKRADGMEEGEEDKKVGVVGEVKEDKEADGVKEVKEGKEVDGVEEVKEDKKIHAVEEVEGNKKDDNGSENGKMDEETEVKQTTERKEEKEKVEDEKPEVDAMEVEGNTKDEEEGIEEEKIEEEDEDNIVKSKVGEKEEDNKVVKGKRKRGRGKIDGEKKEKIKELKKAEPRTPTIDRPVRERKSVDRLVASIEKDATKGFHIEKGHGTPLKDIPNVAFKLSRRKADDTFKLLHTILFGRRGKAVEIKSNISRFSGFVWHDNEEKQMIKVKEKFDKCNKEKLLEFCDVLDITIAKATTRKEDIVAKLIDFLVAPHATTTLLLAEKEKSSKGKKRKRVAKRGSSRSGTTTSKRSAKGQKKNVDSSVVDERKSTPDTEDESEEEEKDEEHEEENGVPDKSEDEMPEQSESEDKTDSGNESEDVKKSKKPSKTSSTKKESATKSKTEKITVTNKSRLPSKRAPKKSSAIRSKIDDDSDGSPKVFSRKKKNEKGGKKKASTPAKSSSKEKTEKVTKGKGKNKEKLNPSDDQLRDAICEILKEVDFNTATFTDILKQLAKQFDRDLTPRKASIKLMIQEELTKLADEADEDDEEGDAEKDETRSTGQEAKV